MIKNTILSLLTGVLSHLLVQFLFINLVSAFAYGISFSWLFYVFPSLYVQSNFLIFYIYFEISLYALIALPIIYICCKFLKNIFTHFMYSIAASIGFFALPILYYGKDFFRDGILIVATQAITVFLSYIVFTSKINRAVQPITLDTGVMGSDLHS